MDLSVFWWLTLLASCAICGLWYLFARNDIVRRFCITLLTLSVAGHLLFAHNKMWVGDQGINAEMNVEPGGVVSLTLRDVAGRIADFDDADQVLQLRNDALKRLTKKNENGEPRTEIASIDQISFTDGIMKVDFDGAVPDQRQLASWLTDRSFKVDNPARSLLHVNLGIDLRGGVEFTCRLYKNGEVVPADDEVIGILRRRLDARGLTEPQVFRLTSGDVQVVIPGGTEADAARTRAVLEATGRLETRKVMYYIQERHVRHLKGGAITFATGYDNPKAPFEDVVYKLKEPFEDQTGLYEYAHLGTTTWTGEEVAKAEVSYDESGELAVAIALNAKGGAANQRFTQELYDEWRNLTGADNRPVLRKPVGNGTIQAFGILAISLDGTVESAPYVRGPSGSNTQISGNFSQDEADTLTTVLKAGALTVTPRVISERVVGPSLGQETIQKGGWSMAFSLLLVVIMMVFFYRLRLGFVANTSLAVTVGLIFVVLSVFSATLTLPGLAGLVLTVGMAVDANILIFERLREELTDEVDLATGIENGYGRAFITIIDANLTTFITAFILYLFGAGPVQGFGLTLMIGIGTSMFGALYVGRMVTDFLYRRSEKVVVPQLVKPIHIAYTNYRKPALVLSLAVAVGSWVWFVSGKPTTDDRFGIDFTGGFQVQVNFEKGFTVDELTTKLAEASKSSEEAAILDPISLQLLPYFADFGQAGEKSNQYVIKGRDPEGADLERDRAVIEDQMSSLVREREAESRKEDADQVKMKQMANQITEKQAEVHKLEDELEKRQRVFKDQLLATMGESIGEEGQELEAAKWVGPMLSLRLGVISQPSADALVAVKAELEERNDIKEVDINAVGSDTDAAVDLSISYVQPPGSIEGVYTVDDALGRRLQALLGTNPDNAAAKGQLKAADEMVKAVSQIMAGRAIAIDKPFPSSQHFSPLVGDQMKRASLVAMIISILAILAYVAARFEFRYGIGAIVALIHDVVITIGLLSLFDIQIDLTVVAALLTIIGYSLNDTMVVFDRIRENIAKMERSLAEIIDTSIAQTMSRTVLTTMTTVIVVLILVLFGGEGLAAFSGTLLIGLLLGTYSSVFVASPVLLMLNKGRPASELVAKATVEDDEEPGLDGYMGETGEEAAGEADDGKPA